jgi:hypothetical protein
MRSLILLSVLALATSGCMEDGPTTPRDYTPPSAPRGLYSVTGDHEVFLHWMPNPESDVVAYRIYAADCPGGDGCPYASVGATEGVDFAVVGLPDGVTRWFAVTAVDRAGNESELSHDFVHDTPRPEGWSAAIEDYYLGGSPWSGWDFSSYGVTPWDASITDMFFGYDGTRYDMFVPDYATDIQDAGYVGSLDAIDLAPGAGWSPTGSVELIPGHAYVVWTRDDHYAKFRVLRLIPPSAGRPAQVVFDWAYQVDPGNRELRLRPLRDGRSGPRPRTWAVPGV